MAAKKLDITRILSAVNTKNHGFYNDLTEEELKEFNPYILMRFISNPDGDADVQSWFIEILNEYVNKDFWDLSKNHKELLWKLYAATGAGMPVKYTFLPMPSRETVDKFEQVLADMNPDMKMQDVKLLAAVMTKEEKSQLFDNLGFDKKQRASYE
jgi:hypothetical protein